MQRVVISSVTVVATLLQANELSAQHVSAIPPERPVDHSAAFMQVYGPAPAPQGFLCFCEENPEECRASSDAKARLAASPRRLNELDDINRRVID
jgi:predicted transglutaminase-like cysteine proteinase